jgi:hypothetical protein
MYQRSSYIVDKCEKSVVNKSFLLNSFNDDLSYEPVEKSYMFYNTFMLDFTACV